MAKNSDAMIKNMKKEIAENQKEIVWLNEENAELMKRNRALERQIERFLFCVPNAEKFLICRVLPAELLNEVFASLSLKNAFGILTKMPNGYEKQKWNEADCGPKMAISGGGLVAKHSGPFEYNCVRAQLAIPKFNLNPHKSIAYFEVEILANSGLIGIGFCTQQFTLEGNWLGGLQNSIGIGNKWGMLIDGKVNSFGNGSGQFQQGEIIGIGTVHFSANSSMKCFATCNGQLLGKVDCPIKFASLDLYPAITMGYPNNSIRANFGSSAFCFNPIPRLLPI